MKNPSSPKERNLLKGAMRRLFSRSDLRRSVIDKALIEHFDITRPRVTKWVFCNECGIIFPKYLAQVDHVLPIIKITSSLEEMTWDEVVDAIWCDESNLKVVDKECHKAKTKEENAARRAYKKGLK